MEEKQKENVAQEKGQERRYLTDVVVQTTAKNTEKQTGEESEEKSKRGKEGR